MRKRSIIILGIAAALFCGSWFDGYGARAADTSVSAYLTRANGTACATSECRLIVNKVGAPYTNYCNQAPRSPDGQATCWLCVTIASCGSFDVWVYGRAGTATPGCYLYSNTLRRYIGNGLKDWAYISNISQRACGATIAAKASLDAFNATLLG